MKIIINFFFLIFFYLLIFFIVILRPIILFRLGSIPSDRLGGFAFSAEMYLLKKKSHKFSQLIIFDIIFCSDTISNYQIFKMIRKKFYIFKTNIFFKKTYFTLQSISYLQVHIINFQAQPFMDISKTKNQLTLTPEENTKGYKLLKNIGLNESSKWVCIHNRDSKFLKDHFLKNDLSYHDFRNFNINTINSTIKYLISKNIHVVRMGTVAEQEIDIKSDFIIDYPFSDFQDELLEIFLFSKCEFFIGCDSGPWTIALLFRKPILLTNYTQINTLNKLHYDKLFIILKKFKFKNNNKLLSLREIYENKAEEILKTEQLDNKGIDLVDNNEDEILNATKELFIQYLSFYDKEKYNNIIQDKFWNILNNKPYSSKNINICNSFLNENKFLYLD